MPSSLSLLFKHLRSRSGLSINNIILGQLSLGLELVVPRLTARVQWEVKVALQVYGQSRGASDGNWDMVSTVLHCQASYLHQLEVANTKSTTELTTLMVY
jgi:hypothetical protein